MRPDSPKLTSGTMPIPARPPRRLDALGDDTEARLAASAGRHAAAIDRAAVPRLPPVSSSRARRLPAVDITTSHASFAVAGSKLGTGSAASVRRSSVRRGTGEGEVRGSIPGGTREHERDAPRAPPSNGGASRLEALRVDASDSRARREAKKRERRARRGVRVGGRLRRRARQVSSRGPRARGGRDHVHGVHDQPRDHAGAAAAGRAPARGRDHAHV